MFLQQLQLKKFDDVFGEQDVDLVKMDVEGSEIAILRGMSDYLSSHKKIKIVMEWNETYRTPGDFEYLKENFSILLLLWESNELKKIKINNVSELFGTCNILLLPK